MNEILSKNSPEDLKKLYRFVGTSETVWDKDVEAWNAWLAAIQLAIKESEDRLKEKI
jgi:hypothetical protein